MTMSIEKLVNFSGGTWKMSQIKFSDSKDKMWKLTLTASDLLSACD